jgi:hypothetical protein
MAADEPPRGDDPRGELDADRLEEDWKHALDLANQAVDASSRSRVLRPPDAAAAGDRIREERRWLGRFSPTLHKLFPRRRSR